MTFEQRIAREYARSILNGILRSSMPNLVGTLVVVTMLCAVVHWSQLILPLMLRLAAIWGTHQNANRLQTVLDDPAATQRQLLWFCVGLAFAGLSWAALFFPLEPKALLTLPGLVLITATTTGASMISLTAAPVKSAMFSFLGGIGFGLLAYMIIHFDEMQWVGIATLALTLIGILTFSSTMASLGRAAARAKVENQVLTTDLQLALAKAEEASRTDPLTGLANRRAFFEAAQRLIDNTDRPFTLMLIDLDHFKQINDENGHAMGDMVLRSVGQLLATIAPAIGQNGTIAARIGGEEFAVLLNENDASLIGRYADNVRRAIAGLSAVNWQQRVKISASIGFAVQTYDESLWDLQRRADRALYRAKENGRDQVQAA